MSSPLQTYSSSDACVVLVCTCVWACRGRVSSPLQTYIKLTFLQRSHIGALCVARFCVAIYVRAMCVACVLCTCASVSVLWTWVLPFANVYQTHLPPALISELRASRAFGWRSVPAVRCMSVLQQQLHPTAVCTVTHTHIRTHFVILPSALPRQTIFFTLQRATYEQPHQRLKAKFADNIIRHVKAGRAQSCRLTTATCSSRRKPGSSSLHGEARAHDGFRPFRQHPQPQAVLGLRGSSSQHFSSGENIFLRTFFAKIECVVKLNDSLVYSCGIENFIEPHICELCMILRSHNCIRIVRQQFFIFCMLHYTPYTTAHKLSPESMDSECPFQAPWKPKVWLVNVCVKYDA